MDRASWRSGGGSEVGWEPEKQQKRTQTQLSDEKGATPSQSRRGKENKTANKGSIDEKCEPWGTDVATTARQILHGKVGDGKHVDSIDSIASPKQVEQVCVDKEIPGSNTFQFKAMAENSGHSQPSKQTIIGMTRTGEVKNPTSFGAYMPARAREIDKGTQVECTIGHGWELQGRL